MVWELYICICLGRKLTLIALQGLVTFTGIAASIKTYLASRNLGTGATPDGTCTYMA